MFRKLFKTLAVTVIALTLASGLTACRKPKDPASPAEMKQKLQSSTRFLLWKFDATDQQKADFNQMLDGLSADFFAVQQEGKALTKQAIDALDAPTIDVAELERIGTAGGAVFERYLKRSLQAAVDISKILTAEQRHKMIKFWREYEFGE
jgi:uncharacterized membrane protein